MKLKAIEGIDLVRLTASRDAVTTSRIVAEAFKKKHKDVLRQIEKLRERNERLRDRRTCAPISYTDSMNRKQKEYILNRDGFMFLAMTLSGKEADKWRWRFIDQFNAMETWIKERIASSIEYRLMAETLDEVRRLHGKETKAHHYSNEAKLINWAMTGNFSRLDRENLSAEDLDLLRDLQKRNAVLIGAGMAYSDRKEALRIFCELRKDKEAA